MRKDQRMATRSIPIPTSQRRRRRTPLRMRMRVTLHDLAMVKHFIHMSMSPEQPQKKPLAMLIMGMLINPDSRKQIVLCLWAMHELKNVKYLKKGCLYI